MPFAHFPTPPPIPSVARTSLSVERFAKRSPEITPPGSPRPHRFFRFLFPRQRPQLLLLEFQTPSGVRLSSFSSSVLWSFGPLLRQLSLASPLLRPLLTSGELSSARSPR